MYKVWNVDLRSLDLVYNECKSQLFLINILVYFVRFYVKHIQ